MKKDNLTIPNTPIRFIWFAVKPFRFFLLGAVLMVFLAQLFSDLVSVSIRELTDTATAFEGGKGSLGIVLFWVMSYPALLLLSTLSVRAGAYLMNSITVKARTRTIKTLFEYLSLHSLAYFNDRFSGTLSTRVNTVAGNVSRLMGQFVWNIMGSLFSLIISSFIIFGSSQTIGIVFLFGFLILIPINFRITKGQIGLSELNAKTRSKLVGRVIDSITNISAVQQFAQRQYEINTLDTLIEEHRKADVRSDHYRTTVVLINGVLIITFIAGIIFWSFKNWTSGIISLGELLMIVALTRMLINQLMFIGQNLNNLMEAYGEVKDGINEIIIPHQINDVEKATDLKVSDPTITLKNLGFVYTDENTKVFENLSIEIKAGEKVGVVGTSGAGKTTLIKLLTRQHDIQSGEILIDGQNIQNVTQESLRQNISVVPQEPMLFHRTIKENISYGNLGASDKQIIEVAKKAKAHEFIEKLPKKYKSLVGERGVKLSAGQKQRVAIARAFIKKAPILILDEATSALDSESEVAVQEALHNLMKDKTVLAIAHRLSTLREMDRILVFEEGKIVEDGTHQSLLRKKGVYASLWKHQAGGFIDK